MTTNILLTGVGGQGTVLLSRLIGEAALGKGLNVRGSETIGMAQRGGSVVSHLRLSDCPIASPLIPPGRGGLLIAFEPGEAVRALPFLAPAGRLLVLDRGVRPASSGPASNGPASNGPASGGPASGGSASSGPASNGPASGGSALGGSALGGSALGGPASSGYDPAAMTAYLEERFRGAGALTLFPGDALLARCPSPRCLNIAVLGAALAGGLLPFTPEEILLAMRARIPPRFLAMNEQALRAGMGG